MRYIGTGTGAVASSSVSLFEPPPGGFPPFRPAASGQLSFSFVSGGDGRAVACLPLLFRDPPRNLVSGIVVGSEGLGADAGVASEPGETHYRGRDRHDQEPFPCRPAHRRVIS